VHTTPGSAAPQEQLHTAGSDAKAIEAAVRALLGTTQAISGWGDEPGWAG
jgi:hypothetical protein